MYAAAATKRFAGRAVPQLPGHPQGNAEDRVAVADDCQLLAATRERRDGRSEQQVRPRDGWSAVGERVDDVWAQQADLVHDRADDHHA